MPYTINGIGTHYWGKSNLFVTEGTCEFCGRHSKLETYDTVNYFTVVFFPVIPLGKKRVMSDCTSCRRHRVMPYRQWKQAVDSAMESIMQSNGQGEAEGMKELLGTLVGLQATEAFEKIMGGLERRTWERAETLSMISEAYLHFNHWDQSLTYAERAYQKDPSIDNRRQLVSRLALKGNTSAIRPHLDHTLHESAPDIPLLMSGVEGLVAANEGQLALPYLQRIQDLHVPADVQQEVVKLMNIASNPGKGPAKALRKAYREPKPVKHGTSFGTHFARWAMSAVLLGLFSMVVPAILDSKPEAEVMLVNGLDRSYTILLNGERQILTRNQSRWVTVEGPEVTWSDADPDQLPDIPEGKWDLPLGLMNRTLGDDVYALNPDESALILFREMEYRTEETMHSSKDPKWKFHIGKQKYTFRDVDYAFREMPKEVDLYNVNAKWVTGVEVMRDMESGWMYGAIAQEVGVEEADNWVRQQLVLNPKDEDLKQLASAVLPAEDILAALKPLLDAYPLNVEAHRTAQGIRMMGGTPPELEAEYLALMEKHPEDANAYYLYGRIQMDDAKGEVYFRKAVDDLIPPSPYAYFALSYMEMNRGNPMESRDLLEVALSLQPGNPTFNSRYPDLLWATGDQERLFQKLDLAVKLDGESMQTHQETILAHMCFGHIGRAEERARNLGRMLAKPELELSKEEQASLMRNTRFLMAYVKEDFDVEQHQVAEGEQNYADFMIKATKGDYGYCQSYVKEEMGEAADPHFYAVLYLLAMGSQQEGKAVAHAEGFFDLTQHVHLKGDVFKTWMTAGSAPPVEEVIQLDAPPEIKKYYVAMLCAKYPELKEPLKDLQAALNYHPGFPARLLEL